MIFIPYKYNLSSVFFPEPLGGGGNCSVWDVFACPHVVGSVGTYVVVCLNRSDFAVVGDSEHLFLAVVLAAECWYCPKTPNSWDLQADYSRVGIFCHLTVHFLLNIRGNMGLLSCCDLRNCDNMKSLICTAIQKLKIELCISFIFLSFSSDSCFKGHTLLFCFLRIKSISENVISQDAYLTYKLM